MKRVFLIHGWDGYPENCWFPWLKKELESKNFKVEVPAMPNAEKPKIEPWVSKLKSIVGEPNEDTYFVGHSIGNQAIMRYLQELPKESKIGGFISVAGFFNLPYLKTQEEKKLAKPWLKTPIDTNKIKQITKKIIAIFSDNDLDVPLSDKEIFKEKLNAEIIIEKNKGHFSDDAGIKELPIVLKKLLEIANE